MSNYYLSEETYNDLIRLIRQEIEGSTDNNRRPTGGSKLVSYIYVTGEEVDGWYPCTAQSWNTAEQDWITYADAWASDANNSPLVSGVWYLGIRYGGRPPEVPFDSGFGSGFTAYAKSVVEFVCVGSLPVGCGLKWESEGDDKGKLTIKAEDIAGEGLELTDDDCPKLKVKAGEGIYVDPDGIHTDYTIYQPTLVQTAQSDWHCQTLKVLADVNLVDDELYKTFKYIQFVGKISDTEIECPPEDCETFNNGTKCILTLPSVECEDCPAPMIENSCCEVPMPATLYLTFTGSLAGLGTVTVFNDGFYPTLWRAGWEPLPLIYYCETVIRISISCYSSGWEFSIQDAGSDEVCEMGGGADLETDFSCSPVHATGSGLFFVGVDDMEEGCPCEPVDYEPFTVTISASPPE